MANAPATTARVTRDLATMEQVAAELEDVSTLLLSIKELAAELINVGTPGTGPKTAALEALAEKAGAISDGLLDKLGAMQVVGGWDKWRAIGDAGEAAS